MTDEANIAPNPISEDDLSSLGIVALDQATIEKNVQKKVSPLDV